MSKQNRDYWWYCDPNDPNDTKCEEFCRDKNIITDNTIFMEGTFSLEYNSDCIKQIEIKGNQHFISIGMVFVDSFTGNHIIKYFKDEK